jgi:hypothetical protein
MSEQVDERRLTIGSRSVTFDWRILHVVQDNGRSYVLLDPDDYLSDRSYKESRRAGAKAIKNLLAFDAAGQQLWEAELPTQNDYYYQIRSTKPLIASSFSSFDCEIEPSSGVIVRKTFFK